MKILSTCFIYILSLFCLSAWGLTSPFHSSVAGITIPNTHELAPGLILRGMEPRTPEDIEQLKNYGIERILIFKKTVGAEVEQERQSLLAAGFNKTDILQIDFPWKDLQPFSRECAKTVEAYKFLSRAESENKPVFFHCTVGEDRTGYLAGIYRMIDQDWSLARAFAEELCENGYEAGNPQKPKYKVVEKIRQSLTPLFVKMAFLIKQKGADLSVDDCAIDPEADQKFIDDWSKYSTSLKCKKSKRYPSSESN